MLGSFIRAATATLLTLAVLTGCTPSIAPSSAGNAAPSNPKAAKDLAVYRQLVASQSVELAASIGQDLVARFPGSAEAAEVQRTLPEIAAKAKAIHDKKRLVLIWDYQSGTESGSAQNTAATYSTTPGSEAERIRMILRRHAAWGQSVYLFGRAPGFDCGKDCAVSIRFDEQPAQRLKAHRPETGEPALFIDDDVGFIKKLEQSQRIAIDVGVKGKGTQTLVFEVGGYDPAKFPPLAKK